MTRCGVGSSNSDASEPAAVGVHVMHVVHVVDVVHAVNVLQRNTWLSKLAVTFLAEAFHGSCVNICIHCVIV